MNNTVTPADGLSQDVRSVNGIVTKAIVVTIATFLVAQHLSRLRRQPRGLALYETWASVLIPTFPLAEVVIGVYRFWQRRRTGHPLRYCLAVALDQRALPLEETVHKKETEEAERLEAPSLRTNVVQAKVKDDSIPLSVVSPQQLETQEQTFELKRYLQLSALLTYSLYAIFIEVLWIRRAQRNSRTFLDDFVAITAFAGQILAVTCIGIMALNTEWRTTPCNIENFRKLRSEPDLTDLLMGLAWRTKLPELTLSFTIAIIVQSMTLSMLGGDATGTLSISLPCDDSERYSLANALRSPRTFLALESGEPQGVYQLTRPCYTWKNSQQPDLQGIVEVLADIGYVAAISGSLWPVCILCSILLSMFYRKMGHPEHRVAKLSGKLITSSGSMYLYLSYGLISITIWNLTSPKGWEPWMWKDPWAGRFWIPGNSVIFPIANYSDFDTIAFEVLRLFELWIVTQFKRVYVGYKGVYLQLLPHASNVNTCK